jgi:hypothetical protein
MGKVSVLPYAVSRKAIVAITHFVMTRAANMHRPELVSTGGKRMDMPRAAGRLRSDPHLHRDRRGVEAVQFER